MTETLKDYLDRYADGGIPREEMLAAVAAWPLEEYEIDHGHTLPTHQDNTAFVISAAALNDLITEEDYREIFRRRQGGA